jgi:uncharacterized protein YjbI with pentapeptide repeats
MDRKLEVAVPEALEEAAALRLEDLPNADLKDQDLTKVKGLLPEHLAGADLTRAKLPDEIAKFPALSQVAAISSEARKIFIALLAACVYSWLVVGTTTDAALILNTASSPLPIINTPIPIAGFYVVGATLLTAVYCYFHFYLQRLWRTLATLPALFPDGVTLDDKTDPWLLTNLVRADFKRLRKNAPPLTRLENLLTILLAWWLVPLNLLALWARYLPAHYWLGTTWLLALIGVMALFGRHSYRLARATLRGETPAAEAEGEDGRGVWRRAWQEFRQTRPDRLTVGLTAAVALCSLSAFQDDPQGDGTWLAWLLNRVGIRTFADLREVAVAGRPDAWDGKDWDKVKRVDLRGRNLAFADADSAFLANADLRDANLTGADLGRAQLQGTDLRRAQLQGADLTGAQLQGADLYHAHLEDAWLAAAALHGANLSYAKLQGAVLFEAQLQGADLTAAQLQGADARAQIEGIIVMIWTEAQLQGATLQRAELQGADLAEAQLQGANLSYAQLQGADLSYAQLQGADLRKAQLQGANFTHAELNGADLRHAQLQGADLTRAGLLGADLRETALWRASVHGAFWDYGDLRGANVQSMSHSDIDALVTEATKGIPDERPAALVGDHQLYQENRDSVAERLNAALRTAELPARPNFPEKWRSEPHVMVSAGDPDPEPFDWGRSRWTTELGYDNDLAWVLGELACGRDVPEAQIRGLARRAQGTKETFGPIESEPDRAWPRLFAARLSGPDCPPAKGLPEDTRRQLEQLAARGDKSTAAPAASPPDPIE